MLHFEDFLNPDAQGPQQPRIWPFMELVLTCREMTDRTTASSALTDATGNLPAAKDVFFVGRSDAGPHACTLIGPCMKGKRYLIEIHNVKTEFLLAIRRFHRADAGPRCSSPGCIEMCFDVFRVSTVAQPLVFRAVRRTKSSGWPSCSMNRFRDLNPRIVQFRSRHVEDFSD